MHLTTKLDLTGQCTSLSDLAKLTQCKILYFAVYKTSRTHKHKDEILHLNTSSLLGCINASSLCQGLRYYRTVALAKEPAKSRPGHCDLDSPQPINCQCEMPHYNYLFMIIFLSSVCYFERSRAKLAFMTFAS